MLLGYNTNGFAHHDPLAAVGLLAEIGYGGVALTLDHGLLNPYGPGLDEQLAEMRGLLSRLGLRSVIETGARYLLDPRHQARADTPDGRPFAAGTPSRFSVPGHRHCPASAK